MKTFRNRELRTEEVNARRSDLTNSQGRTKFTERFNDSRANLFSAVSLEQINYILQEYIRYNPKPL